MLIVFLCSVVPVYAPFCYSCPPLVQFPLVYLPPKLLGDKCVRLFWGIGLLLAVPAELLCLPWKFVADVCSDPIFG